MNDLEQRPQARKLNFKTKNKEVYKGNTRSFFVAFFISLILILICSYVFYLFGGKAIIAKYFSPEGEKIVIRNNFTLPFSPQSQNLLVMGVDPSVGVKDPFKGARSDTIILVSIAPYGKSINAISIPRDSKVYFAGSDTVDKINHTFAKGGAKLTVKTVEQTLGVKISHYIVISNKGIREMVDAMGGLPIYVEKDMYYKDNTSGLSINLKKGDQVLTGSQAEGYLRFRKDSLGDIGRVQRQQWFLRAVAKKFKDPATLTKLPELLKILPKYIQTDMSVYELSQYAALAKSIDLGAFEVATLPGSPSKKGQVSYWILNPDKTQDVINKLVYREESPATEVLPNQAGILYVPAREEEAKQLKALLEQDGYEVVIQQRRGLGHNQISLHNSKVSAEMLNAIKGKITQIQDFPSVYDATGFNKANKDFTIVLAE